MKIFPVRQKPTIKNQSQTLQIVACVNHAIFALVMNKSKHDIEMKGISKDNMAEMDMAQLQNQPDMLSKDSGKIQSPRIQTRCQLSRSSFPK